MNSPPSARNALILLVVAWPAWIAIQAWRSGPSPTLADPAIMATDPTKPNRVVAYYFHATARCTTCRTIQTYSEEALAAGFREALASGDLEWRLVNIQRPENRHFVQDYGIYARSVVITRFREGREVEWKNLEAVWDLVESRPLFVSYIQRHLREYLGRL